MTASKLVDGVKIVVNSTGTGAITLGEAVPSFRGVEALINGDQYSYAIQTDGQFEWGTGTYLSSSQQLTRSPLWSSDGGAPIDLPANAQVSFVALAEDLYGPSYATAAQAAEIAAEAAADRAETALAEVQGVATIGVGAVYETWSALSTYVPTEANIGAIVIDSDIGTHTDPVTGATVANAGIYTSSLSPVGWKWVAASTSTQVAEDAALAEAWAQSPTPPDPDDPDSKSAKTLVTQVQDAVYPTLSVTSAIGTFVADTYVNSDGTTSSATGYGYIEFEITPTMSAILATGYVNGNTRYLANYYSDAGGTAFLSHDANSGGSGSGTQYTNVSLAPPTGAVLCRVNTYVAGNQPHSVTATDVRPNIASDVDDLKAQTADITDIRETLYAYTPQAAFSSATGKFIAYNTGIAGNGSTNQYAIYDVSALTATQLANLYASGQLSNNATSLVVYYSDAAATTYLGYEQRPGSSGATWTRQKLSPPTGTKAIAINTLTTVAPALELLALASNVATRLKTAETSLASNTSALAIATATLSDWVTQAPTASADNYYLNNTGAVTSGANNRYAMFAYTAGQDFSVSSDLGAASGYWLLHYYNATGSQIGQDQQWVSATSLKVSTKARDGYTTIAAPPAGTASIGVNGRTTAPIKFDIFGVVPNISQTVAGLSAAQTATQPICVAGDSTAQIGSTGIADEIANAYPGRTVYGPGIGGTRAEQTAAMLGAEPLTITITGGVIPTSGTVACTLSVDIFNGNANSMQVMVGNTICKLIGSSTVGAYTIGPMSTLPATVAVASGSTVLPLTLWVSGSNPASAVPIGTALSGTVLIRTGINNLAQAVDAATTLGHVVNIVNFAKRYTDKILVFGVMPGQADIPAAQGGLVNTGNAANDIAISYARLANCVAFNASLGALYAAQYLDPAALHKAKGGTVVATVNGVNFDVMSLDASVVCTIEGRHENATPGQTDTVNDLVVPALTARVW